MDSCALVHKEDSVNLESMECHAGREGSITCPFLYIGPFRILKVFELEVAEISTCNRQRNLRQRISETNHHRWGRGWLYSKKGPRKGKRSPPGGVAVSPQGAHPRCAHARPPTAPAPRMDAGSPFPDAPPSRPG